MTLKMMCANNSVQTEKVLADWINCNSSTESGKTIYNLKTLIKATESLQGPFSALPTFGKPNHSPDSE